MAIPKLLTVCLALVATAGVPSRLLVGAGITPPGQQLGTVWHVLYVHPDLHRRLLIEHPRRPDREHVKRSRHFSPHACVNAWHGL